MKQQTLAMAAAHIAQYERYRKTIWRKAILAAMEQIVPWSQLCSVIEPYVPKYGKGPPAGRSAAHVAHVLQLHWFKLVYVSCEGCPSSVCNPESPSCGRHRQEVLMVAIDIQNQQVVWQFSGTEKLQYQSRQGRSGRGVRSIRLWQVHVD